MSINRSLRAALAATLSLGLLAGGAASAHAAPGDVVIPQPNGSKGAFFIYNEEEERLDDDPNYVYDRSEFVTISGSHERSDAVIPVAGIADNIKPGEEYDEVFKFVVPADPQYLTGGRNEWLAYQNTSVNKGLGGVWYDNFTLEERGMKNGGGIEQVFADGGDYYAGIAFTNTLGFNVTGVVYRTVHVEKGTGKYTVEPVTFEGEGPVDPEFTEADLTPATEIAGLVSAPAENSTVLTINAGVANASKTVQVNAFSTKTDLGQVTLDAAGTGTVDVAGKIGDNTAHKLVLSEAGDNTKAGIIGWGGFQLNLTSVTSSDTPLEVEVTTSNKFELVAPAAAKVDLGDVKRNQETTPVNLGQFSVIDDRDVLKGWDLNAKAADFAGPNAAKIGGLALGYAPSAVSTLPTGVSLGTAKAAGGGAFGAIASGAAGSATTEAGSAFDLALSFKAPVDAAKGQYTSTLTLDLVSK